MKVTRHALTTEALLTITQELCLDAKRRPSRKGIEGWYSYYAGFSESFARTVLESIPIEKGATVLDPWNGSGTTTSVADSMGFKAIGFDLNPVAALVSNAKLARHRDAEHVLGLARHILESIKSEPPTRRFDDPLSAWLRPSVAKEYRLIESGIISNLATGQSGIPIDPKNEALPPLAAFLILGLVRAARSMASLRTSTNPTWITPGEEATGSRAMLRNRWIRVLVEMAKDLYSNPLSSSQTLSATHIADARDLPIPDGTVDLVLTSPPYCTRIDYIVSASFELAALGVGRGTAAYDQLRRNCMGTPLTRERKLFTPKEEWPSAVNHLLKSIQGHSSADSQSYYFKTYWQYFNDCELALKELRRTLRPGGAAILVLQSSYYKDIYVDLPELYVSLGKSLGFTGAVVSAVEVKRSLSQINTRSLAHRSKSNYFESVVTLEREN